MIFQNLVIVHLVNAVSGCDDHIRFMRIFQKADVLCNGICRSAVPVSVLSGEGRREQEHPALLTSKVPPFGGAEVLIQTSRIELGKNCNLLYP